VTKNKLNPGEFSQVSENEDYPFPPYRLFGGFYKTTQYRYGLTYFPKDQSFILVLEEKPSAFRFRFITDRV
jgi:hypothetical protein